MKQEVHLGEVPHSQQQALYLTLLEERLEGWRLAAYAVMKETVEMMEHEKITYVSHNERVEEYRP